MRDETLGFRREVEADDCRRVRGIVESTGFFSAEETRIAEELVLERLERGPGSGYEFLFAENQGDVAGYTCYGRIPGTVSSYDLYWIAVRQDLRGKGVGRALMARTEALISAEGGTRVYAETSSRAQYEGTRRFYSGCGYAVDAVLEGFYAPGDGKVVFRKTLG